MITFNLKVLCNLVTKANRQALRNEIQYKKDTI